MGKEFEYTFYDKDGKKVKNYGVKGFNLNKEISTYHFERIEKIFELGFLEKREDKESYGLLQGRYTLAEIIAAVNEASKKYTPKEIFSVTYHFFNFEYQDSLLMECFYLTMLVCDAENYNKKSENKVEYVSFGYC